MFFFSWNQCQSVQLLSYVQLSVTPWTAAHQASLCITNFQSLLKLMTPLSHDAIQPSHPLSSPSSPAFNLSQHHGLFQRVSSSHQVAKILKPMSVQSYCPEALKMSDYLLFSKVQLPMVKGCIGPFQERLGERLTVCVPGSFFNWTWLPLYPRSSGSVN